MTDERVADRPADDQREEASVNPLLCVVLFFCPDPKPNGAALRFSSFWVVFLDAALIVETEDDHITFTNRCPDFLLKLS